MVFMIKSSVKKIDMTEGPLLGKILLYSLPLIATGMLQLAYNAADTIIVGRYAADGETALAAVGSCGSLINLIVQLFMGLSVGVGVITAQDIGAKRYDDVRRTVHTAIPAAAILGTVVAIFGFFTSESLLLLTGVEDVVLAEAVPYMKAYMLGMPASMLYNYCASMLRAAGDTSKPLIFLTISGIINVILNIITVVGLNMGTLGVGIATAVSNWIAMTLILIFMLRTEGMLKFEPAKTRICFDKLWGMIRIGIPAGLQGCVFSLSNVLIQTSVNSFSKSVIAGNTAASNIGNFIYTAMNSLYHATLAFVGQNIGAGKFHRVRKIIVKCSLIVLVIGVGLGALAVIFGRQLLDLYAPGNTGAIEAGMIRTLIVSGTYFLCGLMEVGCGAMRGMGSSIIPMLVSVVGSCVIRIAWIYTVFAAYPTLTVLYISYPVSWLLTAIAHYVSCEIMLRYIKRRGTPDDGAGSGKMRIQAGCSG